MNNSKIVQTEPIYRLAKQNKINEDEGIWKGIRNANGQISLELFVKNRKDNFLIKLYFRIDGIKPFILDKKIISSIERLFIRNEILVRYFDCRNNTIVIKPTFSDIDSAVIWMVNRDLRRGLPSLTQNVKDWINVLHTVRK